MFGKNIGGRLMVMYEGVVQQQKSIYLTVA
jgi:hypothetical protein